MKLLILWLMLESLLDREDQLDNDDLFLPSSAS
jgi:hypothetical protein